MGFFDDVWSAVSDPVGTVEKVVKGVKRGAEKAVKGIKNVGRKTLKGLKKTGKLIKDVGEELGKSETWERGAQKAAKILKAPQEFIEKHDPLRKILPEIDSRFGDRELRSALRFGCKEWLVYGMKNRYKFILTGKTYSYKVV